MALLSRKYIDDNDLVARYLANQLSDADRESFEAYYLQHPELLQELNAAAKFKSGLIELQESGALTPILKQQPWWRNANTLAIAASIIVVVFGTAFWFSWQNASRPLLASSVGELTNQFGSTLPIAATYDIQRTRTSSYDATIRLPVISAAVELRVKPEAPSSSSQYRISLRRADSNGSDKELTALTGLKPAEDGFVPIYLNSAKLSPAIYELNIFGAENNTAAPSSFLIEVIATGQK